jgi:hypothetical protein
VTDDPEDDDQPYDGPCGVCGETVKGTNYMAFGLFAAVSEEGDGLHFEPEEAPEDCETWKDVPMTNCVHALCLQNFFDGMMVDLADRRRRGELQE